MRRIGTKSLVALLYATGFSAVLAPDSLGANSESKKARVERESHTSKQPIFFQVNSTMELAKAYYLHKDYADAEKTFQQALKQAKDVNTESADRESVVSQFSAQIYLSWAEFLASQRFSIGREQTKALTQDEIRTIDDIVPKALETADQTPLRVRSRYYLDALNLFELTGNLQKLEQCKIKCLELASELAQLKNTTSADLLEAYSIYQRLAVFTLKVRQPNDKPKRIVLLDSNIEKPGNLTEKNFTECAKYREQGVAILDRLPRDDVFRISAHRELALFYMLLGKSEFANKQRNILSELMGTNDEKLLFPKYLGCGRFEGQKSNTYALCGMG